MRKTCFLHIMKTKAQNSCPVTAQLIRAFVFARLIVQFLFFLNFKPLAICCGSTARFLLDLVGNPEDSFSHDVALRVIVRVCDKYKHYENMSVQ